MNMRYAWGVIYNEETSKKYLYIFTKGGKQRKKKKIYIYIYIYLHLPFKILKKREN